MSGIFQLIEEDLRQLAFVGAGGKTSIIHKLAEYMKGQGYRVIITTTTHIRESSAYPTASNLERVKLLCKEASVLVAGIPCGDGKLSGFSEADRGCLINYADFVLVEADGARGRSIKAPRAHEPVIPNESDMIVAVVGIDCLGMELGEVGFCVSELLVLLKQNGSKAENEKHILTEEDIISIIEDENGMRKNVGKRKFKVVINKADYLNEQEAGRRIVKTLGKKGIEAFATTCRKVNEK